MDIRCASCGAEQPAEARFCSSCGAALYVSCPNCGAEQAASASFCSSCGYALGGPGSQKATDDLVLASIVEARSAARTFAEDIVPRWSGPPRDDAAVTRRAEKLAAFVADPKEKKLPTWRSLRPLARLCRGLADNGGAAEVSEAVGALERLWGPAAGWL